MHTCHILISSSIRCLTSLHPILPITSQQVCTCIMHHSKQINHHHSSKHMITSFTMNNIHLHHHSSKHMITIFTTNNIYLHNKQNQSHYNNTHHCTYSIMQTTIHCTSSTIQNENKPHLKKTILFKIKSIYYCFLYFIW